jgi:multidrug efflux system outer membrane protein
MKRTLLCLTLALSGCAVGPNYIPPAVDLDSHYVNAEQASSIQIDNQTSEWWRDYHDPLLSSLINQGLTQNLDIQAAIERIQQAQANVRKTGINSALSGGLTISSTESGGSANTSTLTSSSTGLDASFVIDLFGGIQRERQSALASLVSAQADVQTVRLAWLAEIITAYSNARYYQQAIKHTHDTITARQQTVEVTQRQYDFGAITRYDLTLTKALLASAQAVLPEYQALYDANIFALGSLLDRSSQPLFDQMVGKEQSHPLTTPERAVETGIPADLLRNRPDIRSIEALFKAAVADVGVAEAALYPSLSLTGSIARTSGDSAWSFGPTLTLPIFNQGALSAERDAAESLAKQAELDWRSAILAAVEDVQVAQSNLLQQRERATAYKASAQFYEQAFELAQENYRAGAITLLELLDTDRSTASARISAASSINDLAKAWATLQIAVGAGQKVTP